MVQLAPLKDEELAPLATLFSFEQYEYLRKNPRIFYELCRREPAVFIGYMFRVSPGRLHWRMHEFLKANRDAGVCLPRGHAKTVSNVGLVVYELGHDHNLRIPVVQNTSGEAEKSVSLIKQLIEDERVRRIFPTLLPGGDVWGKQALTVARTAFHRDPSVTANAILGNAGMRADILDFDDIEDLDNSIRQPARRLAVEEAYANTWMNTLRPGGKIRRWFTPWHVAGVGWKWVQDRDKPDAPKIFYEPVQGDYNSPWPEYWSRAELRRRERSIGSGAFARAFKLVPTSGEELVFDQADIEAGFFHELPQLKRPIRLAAIDLAFTDDTANPKGKNEADYSTILIADVDRHGHVWCRRLYRGRVSWPKFQAILLDEATKWKPQMLSVESNGPMKGFAQEVTRLLSPKGIHIKKLPRLSDKHARAMAVQSVVEQHKLRIPSNADGSVVAEFAPLVEELSAIPLGEHDDAADVAVDIMAESMRLDLSEDQPVAAAMLGNTHKSIIDADVAWRERDREERLLSEMLDEMSRGH